MLNDVQSKYKETNMGYFSKQSVSKEEEATMVLQTDETIILKVEEAPIGFEVEEATKVINM